MAKCIDFVDEYLYSSYMSVTDADITIYKEGLRDTYEMGNVAQVLPNFDDYLIIAALYKFDIGLRGFRNELAALDKQDVFDKNNRKRAFAKAYSLNYVYYLGTELQILIEYWATISTESYPMSDSLATYLQSRDRLFYDADKYYFEIDGSLPKLLKRVGNSLSDIYTMILKRADDEIEELESMKSFISRYYKPKTLV